MKPLDHPYLYIQTSGLSVNGIAKSAMPLLYQVLCAYHCQLQAEQWCNRGTSRRVFISTSIPK